MNKILSYAMIMALGVFLVLSPVRLFADEFDENCLDKQGFATSYDACWQKVVLEATPTTGVDDAHKIKFNRSVESLHFSDGPFTGTYNYLDERCYKMENIQSAEDFDLCKKAMIQKYKIHLMPKLNQIRTIVQKIIRTAYTNPEFASLIYDLKVMPGPMVQWGALLPLIVIYPADGQEKAQHLANWLVKLLQEFEPLTLADLEDLDARSNGMLLHLLENHKILCPRMNIPFLSTQAGGPLMCYAQGEGSWKTWYTFLIGATPKDIPHYHAPLTKSAIAVSPEFGLAFGYMACFPISAEARALAQTQPVFATLAPADQKIIAETPINKDLFECSNYNLRFLTEPPPNQRSINYNIARKLGYALNLNSLTRRSPPFFEKANRDEFMQRLANLKIRTAETSPLKKLFENIYDFFEKDPANYPSRTARLVTEVEVRAELERFSEKPVLGPIQLGELLFDKTYNWAILPPDFISSEPHDYRLLATEGTKMGAD